MTITKTFLPLFKGIDLSTRKLPLIKIDSGKPGPTVWLTAAIHGDEVTGTAIVHSFLSKIQNYPIENGIVYTFPIMNPAGFENITRGESLDQADLNRQFPGDAHGSSAERHAHIIAKSILGTKPDYVIDLHTDSMNSIGYCIVDYLKMQPEVLRKTLEMVETLGFPWGFDLVYKGYDPTTSLSGYLLTQQVPAITIELGGPLVVDEYFRKKGLESIWHFLSSLGMVATKQPVKLKTKLPEKAYLFEEEIECDSTGIIDYRVKPGESFHKGQIMGKIRNIYGKEIEIIRAPSDGILYSHEDQSIAFPGQLLFTYVTEVRLSDYLK
jgi:predicted deacylase